MVPSLQHPPRKATTRHPRGATCRGRRSLQVPCPPTSTTSPCSSLSPRSRSWLSEDVQHAGLVFWKTILPGWACCVPSCSSPLAFSVAWQCASVAVLTVGLSLAKIIFQKKLTGVCHENELEKTVSEALIG